MLLNQKICPNCNLSKNFSEFYKDKHQSNGYKSFCKKCEHREKRKRILKTKENYFKEMLIQAKYRAKRKNYEFNLDLEWMILNCPTVCPIYNTPLIVDSDNDYQKPSIDRIDNNKGYEKDNCRIISWAANRLRGNATLEELERLVIYLKSN